MKTKKKTTTRRRPKVAIKRVLVPLDGSDHALKALDYAVEFAQFYGARIDIVRIVEPTVYPAGSTIPQRHFDPDELSLKLARAQMKNVGEKQIPEGITWRSHVSLGNPYAEIVALAGRLKTDMLFVTTHGYTGLQRFLLGSAAEKIIRHAPCPVMVVRDEVGGAG